MQTAPDGRSDLQDDRGDRETGRTVSAVRGSLDECRILLRDAEEAAAELRERAQQDALRMRKDATEEAARRIERAAECADLLTEKAACRAAKIVEAAAAREAELGRRAEALRASEQTASARAERTIAEAEHTAARLRQEAEDEGVTLLRAAWEASVRLQQDLLDEAEAEVADMLRRAEADAIGLRGNAERFCLEARRLQEEAQRVRDDADRYFEQLATAALHAMPEPAADRDAVASEESRSRIRSWARRLRPVALVLLLGLGVQHYIAEPYAVAGTSMLPALADGDRVILNKVSYRFHPPRRGDVVVIAHDGGTWKELFVKRVIALPGERVELRGSEVRIDGRVIEEDYLEAARGGSESLSVRVFDDHVFVLGDNGAGSLDSRQLGLVAIADIVGRIDAVIWPPTAVRLI